MDFLKGIFDFLGGGSKSSSRKSSSSASSSSSNSGRRLTSTDSFKTPQRDFAAEARRREEEEERRRRRAEEAAKRERERKAREEQAKKDAAARREKMLNVPTLPSAGSKQPLQKANGNPLQQVIQQQQAIESQSKAATKGLNKGRVKSAASDYQKNLVKSREQQKSQASFLEKMFNRKDIEERAKTDARVKTAEAIRQREGFGTQEEARLNQLTSTQADRTAREARTRARQNESAVDVIRYMPMAGAGELGANLIRGNFAEDKQDTLVAEQMGITPAEVAQIKATDPEQYQKLLNVSRIGLGAGVLDLVGFGAGTLVGNTVRNQGRNQFRKVTADTLKKNLAGKAGAKAATVNTLAGGGVGGAVGGAGSAYLGATPDQIIENTISGATLGAIGGAASSPLDVTASLTRNGRRAQAQSLQAAETGQVFGNIDAGIKTSANPGAAPQTAQTPQSPQGPPSPTNPVARPDGTVEVSPGIISKNPDAGVPPPTPAPIEMPPEAPPQAPPQVPQDPATPDMGVPPQVDPSLQQLEQNGTYQPVEMPPVETIPPQVVEPEVIETAPVQTEGELQSAELAANPTPIDPAIIQAEQARRAQAEEPMSQEEVRAVMEGRGSDVPPAPAAPRVDPVDEMASAMRGQTLSTNQAAKIPPRGAKLQKAAPAPKTPSTPPTPVEAPQAKGSVMGTLRKAPMAVRNVAKRISKRRQDATPGAALKAEAKQRKRVQKVQAALNDATLEKGKKQGGNISAYLAKRANTITGNAQLKRDLMQGVKTKDKVNFETDYKGAQAKAANMTDEQAIARSKEMFSEGEKNADGTGTAREFRPLSYTQKQEVLALMDKYSYTVDTLAGKKRLTKKEKATLEDTKRAQAELFDLVSESEANSGRSLSLSSWLYKQLDPVFVSERIFKKMADAKAPYSPEQQTQLRNQVRDLKNASDIADDAKTKMEDALKGITKGETTPAELRAATKTHRQAEAQLRDAYGTINDFTRAHWDKAVESGKAVQSKTYGFGLNKYQKLNMLSGISGRFRDVFSTAITSVDVVLDDALRAVTGKGLNVASGSKKFNSTISGSKESIGRGLKEGTRKTWNTYIGREDSKMGLDAMKAPNSRKHAKKDPRTDQLIVDPYEMGQKGKSWDDKSRLQKATSVGANFVRGNVALPSHMFGETYKAQVLNRAGMDEAKRLGLKGDDAKAYAEAMEVNPTEAVLEKADFTSREISGLQSKWSQKIDQVYREMLYKHATWDGDKSKAGWRTNRAKKMASGVGITAAKNTIIPFTSWPLGAAQNMLTRQNPVVNYGKALNEAFKKGDADKANKVLEQISRGNYNLAKMAVVATTLAPFLSDEDADGEAYSPPYVRVPMGNGKYWSNDLSILGPLSAPLVAVYAAKKATEVAGRGEASWAGAFAGVYAMGLLNKVGLASTLSGKNIPLVNLLTDTVANPFTTVDSKAKAIDNEVSKLIVDVVSQSIPISSFLRDMNNIINQDPEYQYTPNTKVMDENGKTDWSATGIKQLMAIFPVVNQKMEDNEDGKKSPSFIDKTFGNKSSSEGAIEKNQENIRAKDDLKGVDKGMRALLDKDTQKLFDKQKEGKDISTAEAKKIRNQIIDGRDKALEESDYDTYLKAQEMNLKKLEEDPSTKKSAIEKQERQVKVATTLKEADIKYDRYKLYNVSGGVVDGIKTSIAQGELKKMLDEESEHYNPDVAAELIEIDRIMAEAGASGNTLDPTKPKYDVDAIEKSLGKRAKGRGGSGSGGRGGKDKGASTDFSLTKTVGRSGNQGTELRYRALKQASSPIPDIASQTPRRNSLRKQITVTKGVKYT